MRRLPGLRLKARTCALMAGTGCGLALVTLALMHLLSGCSASDSFATASQPTGPPWFVDVTDEVHLDFVHDAGPVGSYFLPQIMGSGAALFDFDGDGRLDIYLIQNAGPNSASTNRLYR